VRIDTFIKLQERLQTGWKLAKNSYICVFNSESKEPLYKLYTQDDIDHFISEQEIIESRRLEAQWEHTHKKSWKPFEELEELSKGRATNEDGTLITRGDSPSSTGNHNAIQPKDAVNPSHYQAFFGGIETMEALQWLEAKQYEGQYKDPVKFKAAVSLQIEKYLDRNGGKDKEEQELSKALWYMKFLVAYVKNGDKPIRVIDINNFLKGI
jgi:hypothetical protein